MSATSDLLKQAVPSTGAKTTSLPAPQKGSATANLLKAANVPAGGLAYVPKSQLPEPTKKESLLKKTGNILGSIAKGIVSPVATLIARPFQLGAEALGVSDQKVNEISAKIPFGLVAPTPQNFGDVKKDVGRAVETAALGIPGGTLGKAALAGAAFGGGASLEQGNNLFSKNTAIGVGAGAATGALLHGAFEGASKLFGKEAPAAIESALPKVEVPIETPIATIPEKLTNTEKFAKYSKVNNYEPITPDSQLPTIQTQMKAPPIENKMPGYKYEPAKTPLPNYNNVPEGPVGSTNAGVKLPTTKGTVVTKAASDINEKIVQQGFDSLPAQDLARFNPTDIAQNKENITQLFNTDIEAAKQAAITGKFIPRNIHPDLLFEAVTAKANAEGDVLLQQELAKSPLAAKSSLAGQSLRLTQEFGNQGNAVDLIRQNNEHIARSILKKTGKTLEENIAQGVKELAPKLEEKIQPKISKPNLAEFIKEIKC